MPILRHYTVFNTEQIDGLENLAPTVCAEPQELYEPIAAADKIVAEYSEPPIIQTSGFQASYLPASDTVRIPLPKHFESTETYYATLFHELSHSTGHSKRIDRGLDDAPAPFGCSDYSREELVAELSASFLCATSGISPPTIEQSAAYLQGWINVLKGDKRMIVSAAGAAQKSADWILGRRFNEQAAQSANLPADQHLRTVAEPHDRRLER